MAAPETDSGEGLPLPSRSHQSVDGSKEHPLRIVLFWLPLGLGLLLIGDSLLTGLTTFAYMPQRVHEFITAVPFASGTYLIVLAIRSRRLPEERRRRALRNLILMLVLWAASVTVIGLTHDHHRNFWQHHLPQLAQKFR